MNTAVTILSYLHILTVIGVAVIAVMALSADDRGPLPATTGLVHAALTALALGIIMVGLREMQPDYAVNHVKIGIKLLLALGVCFFSWRATRVTDRSAQRQSLIATLILVAINTVIAVAW